MGDFRFYYESFSGPGMAPADLFFWGIFSIDKWELEEVLSLGYSHCQRAQVNEKYLWEWEKFDWEFALFSLL